MYIVFSVFLYIFEAAIVFYYAKTLFPYKFSATKSVIVTVAFSALSLLLFLTLNNEILNALMIILFDFSVLYLAFNSKLRTAIYHTALLTVCMYLTKFLCIFLMSWVFGFDTKHYEKNLYLFMIDTFISKIFYFIFCRIIVFLATKNKSAYDNGTYWSLFLIPLISSFLIITFRFSISGNDRKTAVMMFFIATVLLILSNILVFAVYEIAQKNKSAVLEYEINKQKQKIDATYLEILEKKNDELQVFRHDLKNHLSTIKDLANSDEINQIISTMYSDIDSHDIFKKTDNKVLDIIISKYIGICEKEHIEFCVESFSENLSFLSSFDISSLMNNLLDNSVEAVLKAADRQIRLELTRNDKYHIINLSNACDEKPTESNGNFVTQKSNSELHGFGTKSIKKIISSNKGEMQWFFDSEKHIFQQIILFPIQ